MVQKENEFFFPYDSLNLEQIVFRIRQAVASSRNFLTPPKNLPAEMRGVFK